MKVTSEFKSIDHPATVGHVCKDPQLQLPVISDNQLFARTCNKSFSDLVLVLIKGRLVLEIRLAT